MSSVRILSRSVFAAVFLVTICYGLQDLRPPYKMPQSSYNGFLDGRGGAIVFPRSISKRYQSGNLGDFKNEIHQNLNDFPQWYKLYKNDQKLGLDDEMDILQEIAQNNYAVGELPHFYNNLIESYDKVANEVQKYSDNDFSKRDQLAKGYPNLSLPDSGKVVTLQPDSNTQNTPSNQWMSEFMRKQFASMLNNSKDKNRQLTIFKNDI